MLDELSYILEADPNRRFIVKIRFDRSIDTFAELSRLSSALQSVDALARTDFENDLRLRKQSLKLRARIISFYVGSPPEVTALTTLPWVAFFVSTLALFVTFTANYDKLKKNIPEMAADIDEIFSRMRGLTRDQIQRLKRAVDLIMAEMLRLPEEQLRTMADRIGRTRQELRLRNQPPEIEFIDLDDE